MGWGGMHMGGDALTVEDGIRAHQAARSFHANARACIALLLLAAAMAACSAEQPTADAETSALMIARSQEEQLAAAANQVAMYKTSNDPDALISPQAPQSLDAPQPPQQPPPPAVAEVDRSAFAGLKAGDDPKVVAEKGKIQIPVLGLAPSGAAAGKVDYVWDDAGKWYVQSVDFSKSDKSPYNLIEVRGSAYLLAAELRTEPLQTADIATLYKPRVSLEGDSAEFPDAIRGDFAIGNVAYSVSLTCKPVKQKFCTREQSVVDAIEKLRILGG
jgi:hypothetical protein